MPEEIQYDPEFHPKDLIRRMAKGELDCDIQAAWNISAPTWYKWWEKHESLRQAYAIGYPKWESVRIRRAEEHAEKGNTAYHKYWATLMGAKAAKALREAIRPQSNQSGNTYNINNMSVNHAAKSETELLGILQTKLKRLNLESPEPLDAEYEEIKHDSEQQNEQRGSDSCD